MSTPAPGGASQRVLRQRGSVGVAAFFLVVAVGLMAVDLIAGRGISVVSLAWLLFAGALLWALFLRPAVVLSATGLRMLNVVRDIDIPWGQIASIDTRWNLKITTDDGASHTAWAIGSRRERPASVQRLLESLPLIGGPRPKPPAKVVDDTRRDYHAAVAAGALPRSEGPVTVRWALEPIAAVLMTLALALALTVLL